MDGDGRLTHVSLLLDLHRVKLVLFKYHREVLADVLSQFVLVGPNNSAASSCCLELICAFLLRESTVRLNLDNLLQGCEVCYISQGLESLD